MRPPTALLGLLLFLPLLGCRSGGTDYSMAIPGGDPLRQVSTLAWIAGSWAEEGDVWRWEEHWTAPSGGTMIGMARMVRSGQTTFTESIRLEERADGIYYVVQPSGQAPTEFLLVEHAGWQAVFSRPAPDPPFVIGYRLQPDGTLLSWTESTEGGEVKKEFFPKRPTELR